ncbi:MAG: hypothetical protein JW741_19405 [Sedimentisphaerales bacterium]|nr:hypothetical protein [Sedimentisphaerales bacterium]
MEKRRTALSLLLVVVGLTVLGYGLFRQSATVASSEDGQVGAAPTSELAVTKEVARGGVKRDESGQIKKTYEGKAPEACST